MKKIIVYLLVFVISLVAFLGTTFLGLLPQILQPLKTGLSCATLGGIGGCVYCLRAVYLNACVHKRWDPDWQPWYYLRPVVSALCGGVSFIFLRAGLLILESGAHPGSSELGFYALAFIAGLNVDKFIGKLEDVAEAVWGIEKSRAAKAASGKQE